MRVCAVYFGWDPSPTLAKYLLSSHPQAHAGSGGGAAAINDDEDVVDMDTDSPSGGEAPMEGISGLGDESAAAILRRSRYFFPSYRYPENNGIDGGGVY